MRNVANQFTINRCKSCNTLTNGISACHACGGETQPEPVSQGTLTLSRTVRQSVTIESLLPSDATESEIKAFIELVAKGLLGVGCEVTTDIEWSFTPDPYVTPITTIEQAKAFLDRLHADGNMYHLEDNPFEVFSAELAPLIDARVAEIYDGKFDWAQFDCPIGYLLWISKCERDEF